MVKITLKKIRVFFLPMALFFIFTNACAQKSNLEILQELSKNVYDSLYSQIDYSTGDSLMLVVKPSPDYWIVEHTLLQNLKDKNKFCLLPDTNMSTVTSIELAIIKMDVKYKSIFRQTFLGQKQVVRVVDLTVSSKVTKDRHLVAVKTIDQHNQDTVALESIHQLENEHILSTKGVLPDDAILDRVLSPVIITLSVAVIVYLFFTLRK